MIAQIELWTLRTLAVFAVLGGVGFWIYHKGGADCKAQWDEEKATQQAALEAANDENIRLTKSAQAKVDAAEAAAAQSAKDLAAYRAAHPVHILSGGLCSPASSHPAGAGEGPGHAPETAGTVPGGVLQPTAARDLGPTLDELMAQADAINSAYRVCLSMRMN